MPSAALLKTAHSAQLLHERLLASASATAVLRDLFGDPVVIRRVAGAAAPATAAQCALLNVSRPDAVMHRRVVLVAAGRPVSEADLWYVPARLWSGMAAALLATDTPFGAVVAPMRPQRETLSARLGDGGAAYALEHEAVLRDRAGAAIALVHEYYLHDRDRSARRA